MQISHHVDFLKKKNTVFQNLTLLPSGKTVKFVLLGAVDLSDPCSQSISSLWARL
jgi:hypothetical protein